MDSPVLVTIDLQRDFYHKNGCYSRHGRPLRPIRDTIEFLKPIVHSYPRVLRIQSIYKTGQFNDMPRLCRYQSTGAQWHPELSEGPLLTKHRHSGLEPLRQFFQAQVPLILSGVCTHRCVRSTYDDLAEHDWPVYVLDGGVASCGRRRPDHYRCLKFWRRRGRTVQANDLLSPPHQQNLDNKTVQLEHPQTA